MSSINKAMLLGNLGDTPELTSTKSGMKVVNFSLATSYGKDDKTEWHRIVAFDKQAEIAAKYLVKGSQVHVEGRIQYRTFEGNDGNKKYFTEIVAERVTLLNNKKNTDSGDAFSD